jgi:glutamate-1-semialdehyde aminotransferase
MEPVIENLAIVLPDEGYLAGVRAPVTSTACC